jgi:3-hexulose-6-phosphate synthase/6-phospho-3-hexuloisomerase
LPWKHDVNQESDLRLAEKMTAKEGFPKLQVAIDLTELEEAVRVAKEAISGGCDWLEAGTPLIKSEGMNAVRVFRSLFPKATIVADMKTLDGGSLEAELGISAGANVVTVSGLASRRTIEDAIIRAHQLGAAVMVDLMGVGMKLECAVELTKLSADYICIHVGLDNQIAGGDTVTREIPVIREIAKSTHMPIAVAGGVHRDNVRDLLRAGASIIIVGAAITKASDPKKATSELKEVMERLK